MKQTAVEWLEVQIFKIGQYELLALRELFEKAKQMEKEEQDKIYDHAFKYGQLSAPELSDEEIEKAFTIGTTQKTEYTHKIEGAKWYRKQLKSKQ